VKKRLRPLSSPLLGENERGGKGAGGLGFPCFANNFLEVTAIKTVNFVSYFIHIPKIIVTEYPAIGETLVIIY
jgi:hypothetical protein